MEVAALVKNLVGIGHIVGWAVLGLMGIAALISGLFLAYRLFTFPGDWRSKMAASAVYIVVCAGLMFMYYQALAPLV